MKRAEPKSRINITHNWLWSVAVVSLALVVGCGDSGTSVPRGTGGTGGTGGSGGVGATGGTGMGGSGGMGGMVGTGGTGGMVGTGGTGGMVGTGGTGGTGGMGGMVGTGGTGGMVGTGGTGGMVGTGGTGGTGGMSGTGGSGGTPTCMTNALCHTCPTTFVCNTALDCFGGYVCVDSGCDTNQGAPIKQCQPSRGGSCATVAECPNATDYECKRVGAGANRCVRVTAGCNGVTQSYDCPFGFSCEGGACVDRRVPCDSFLDCPKSHVCKFTPTANFCVRTYQTCHIDEDCAGLGTFCTYIDNDGTKECAGELGDTETPCVNASCGGPTPVCEAGTSGIKAACGDYGLCRINGDCDTGFVCVGLWQDGRRECVPTGGDCNQVTQCPLQQVCASPRSGGVPSCQDGSVP